jgi:hypothetical protein
MMCAFIVLVKAFSGYRTARQPLICLVLRIKERLRCVLSAWGLAKAKTDYIFAVVTIAYRYWRDTVAMPGVIFCLVDCYSHARLWG